MGLSILIAEEVEKSAKGEEEAPEKPDKKAGSKVKWYVTRGVEEVSRLLKDTNHELDNALKESGKKMGGIAINEDGSMAIDLKKTMRVGGEADISEILNQLQKLRVNDKFADYVEISAFRPKPDEPKIIVKVRVRLPSDLVSSMLRGADPNENWNKAIKMAEKFGKDTLKSL